MKRVISALAVILCLFVLAAGPAWAASGLSGLSPQNPLRMDLGSGSVSFLAELNPAMVGEPLQHFAVYRNGEYADKALLRGFVAPRELFDALSSLGFRPGDNMTMQNWDTTRVEGDALRISVWFEGSAESVDISRLVTDSKGRGIDMRFGGNLKMATKQDASGCLICLFSCPMGIVSNHETFFKETGWWGSVKYTASGLSSPQTKKMAVVTISRK
ncbi:MAG: YdjY domain-containing protein [Acidobacteriota bacterium]